MIGLGVFSIIAKISEIAGLDKLLKIIGFLARGGQKRAQFFAAFLRQRFKHFFFIGEIIIKRAGRQSGAADNITHGRPAISQFRKHGARRL